MDQTAVLQKAESHGGQVTPDILQDDLGWDQERSQRALGHLTKEGLAWVDDQAEGGRAHWIPSVFMVQ